MKITSDMARLHREAAENFYDISQVKAEGREENLRLSIEAYLKTLEYFSIQKDKIEHALIQDNLGTAYLRFAEVREKEKNLELSIRSYEEALKIKTIEKYPVDYAKTTSNIGRVFFLKGDFERALGCFRIAKNIFEKEGIVLKVQNVEKNILFAQESINKIKTSKSKKGTKNSTG